MQIWGGWGGGCTCPVCQHLSLEQTLKKRGGFNTTDLAGAV